jgi:hypothetical protein
MLPIARLHVLPARKAAIELQRHTNTSQARRRELPTRAAVLGVMYSLAGYAQKSVLSAQNCIRRQPHPVVIA